MKVRLLKSTILGLVETPEIPTTKICPYCLSEINYKAKRCPHCTSILEDCSKQEENNTNYQKENEENI